jgi:hypothetical protein
MASSWRCVKCSRGILWPGAMSDPDRSLNSAHARFKADSISYASTAPALVNLIAIVSCLSTSAAYCSLKLPCSFPAHKSYTVYSVFSSSPGTSANIIVLFCASSSVLSANTWVPFEDTPLQNSAGCVWFHVKSAFTPHLYGFAGPPKTGSWLKAIRSGLLRILRISGLIPSSANDSPPTLSYHYRLRACPNHRDPKHLCC